MKILKKTLLILVIPIFIFSCNKTSTVKKTGNIQKQGITTYQYGTHILLVEEGTSFALKSETINLDDFINENATIKGNKIEGYPVDGGPEYIDVVSVERVYD